MGQYHQERSWSDHSCNKSCHDLKCSQNGMLHKPVPLHLVLDPARESSVRAWLISELESSVWLVSASERVASSAPVFSFMLTLSLFGGFGAMIAFEVD